MRGLDDDHRVRVVAENEIRIGKSERGFASFRVAAEPGSVLEVEDVFDTGEEDGVVHGRRELARTTADADLALVHDLAADQGAGAHVPLGSGALADVVVEREHLAGHHPGSVDVVGDLLDVGNPRLAAGVKGRELADLLLDAERLDVGGGQVGLASLPVADRGGAVRRVGGRPNGADDTGRIRLLYRSAGRDRHRVVLVVDDDLSINRLGLEIRAERTDVLEHRCALEPHAELRDTGWGVVGPPDHERICKHRAGHLHNPVELDGTEGDRSPQ